MNDPPKAASAARITAPHSSSHHCGDSEVGDQSNTDLIMSQWPAWGHQVGGRSGTSFPEVAQQDEDIIGVDQAVIIEIRQWIERIPC